MYKNGFRAANMAKQKVILRADAGKTIGFGHFIRSLALAGYLNDYFDCGFCTFNPTELQPSPYQIDEICKVCSFVNIEALNQKEYDIKFLNSLKGDEVVVLDNYYFSTEYQKAIKDKGCRLVCIDDMHDRHFVANAVITVTPNDKSKFSMESYTRFLGGIDHSFLRPEFFKQKLRKSKAADVKKVVLAMGGADAFGLTDKMIEILLNEKPNIELSVIAGDTVDINPKYRDSVNIRRRLSAKEIVNLFSESDMGMFPTSTICMEALACKLPVAAGWYVDNQEELYNYGVSVGLFMPLGNLLDDKILLHERIKKAFNIANFPDATNIDFNKGRMETIGLFKSL